MRLADRFARHATQIKLAVRVTAAGTLAFAAAKLLQLPLGYWTVLTAVIIMQASVGGSLKAALDRFLGTLAGAAWGAVVAIALPLGSDLGLGLGIAAALAPVALLAALAPSFRVAPVTALIVLLPLPGPHPGPLESALERVVEIVVGNVVGLLVAILLLPARAHGHVRAAAAGAMRLNGELLAIHLGAALGEPGRARIPAVHARIRGALKKLETAAEEAQRERAVHLAATVDPEPLVRTLYRVRHDLVMIGRATGQPIPEPVAGRLAPALAALAVAGRGTLDGLADTLAGAPGASSAEGLAGALRGFATELDQLRAEGLIRILPSEAVGRVFTLRFALEQLAGDLDDLAARVGELAGPAARSD